MNLLADENVDGPIVEGLRDKGHDVQYVAEISPGSSDDEVFRRSVEETRALVTSDKDFGEIAFRQGRVTAGIILLRLAGMAMEEKIELVMHTLERHADTIPGNFMVITPVSIRIRKRSRSR